ERRVAAGAGQAGAQELAALGLVPRLRTQANPRLAGDGVAPGIGAGFSPGRVVVSGGVGRERAVAGPATSAATARHAGIATPAAAGRDAAQATAAARRAARTAAARTAAAPGAAHAPRAAACTAAACWAAAPPSAPTAGHAASASAVATGAA